MRKYAFNKEEIGSASFNFLMKIWWKFGYFCVMASSHIISIRLVQSGFSLWFVLESSEVDRFFEAKGRVMLGLSPDTP